MRNLNLRRLGSLTARVMAGVLMALPVRAADEPVGASNPVALAAADQLNEEGLALYAARDYRRAIDSFLQAYAINGDPNLLFNAARCHEELGEAALAIEKYEAFLTSPGGDARGRQRARESLDALLDARALSRSSALAEEGRSAALGDKRSASAEPPARPPKEADPDLLPWLALGGSATLAVVGTTFYLLGQSDHSDVTEAAGYGDPMAIAPLTRREADALTQSGDTKKWIGALSLGGAAALAAGYAALSFWRRADQKSEAPEVSVSWVPSRGGRAVVQGTF